MWTSRRAKQLQWPFKQHTSAHKCDRARNSVCVCERDTPTTDKIYNHSLSLWLLTWVLKNNRRCDFAFCFLLLILPCWSLCCCFGLSLATSKFLCAHIRDHCVCMCAKCKRHSKKRKYMFIFIWVLKWALLHFHLIFVIFVFVFLIKRIERSTTDSFCKQTDFWSLVRYLWQCQSGPFTLVNYYCFPFEIFIQPE